MRSPNETSQNRCGPLGAPARASEPGAFALSISCSVPGTGLSRYRRIPKWGSRRPARVCSKIVSPVEPQAESEKGCAAGTVPGVTSGRASTSGSAGRASAGQSTDSKQIPAAVRRGRVNRASTSTNGMRCLYDDGRGISSGAAPTNEKGHAGCPAWPFVCAGARR